MASISFPDHAKKISLLWN